MQDSRNAFFQPVWRRMAIVVACAGWAMLEWISGQTGWATIAAAVTIYGAWSFFIAWKEPPRKPDGDA